MASLFSLLLLLMLGVPSFIGTAVGANDNNGSGSGSDIFSGDEDDSSSSSIYPTSVLIVPSANASSIDSSVPISSDDIELTTSSFIDEFNTSSIVFTDTLTMTFFTPSFISSSILISPTLLTSLISSTESSSFVTESPSLSTVTSLPLLSSTLITESSTFILSSSSPSLSPSLSPSPSSFLSPSPSPSLSPSSLSLSSILTPSSTLVQSSSSSSRSPSLSPSLSPSSSPSLSPSLSPSSSPSLSPSPTSTGNGGSSSSVVAILGGLFGVSLALLSVVVIILILILCKCGIRPKYVQDYELGQLTDPLGDRTDSVPLLAITSNTNSKLGNLFEHIPDEPSIDLSSLENHVMKLDDEDIARGEFISLSNYNANFSHVASELSTNAIKNRYINILPFDETRVVLCSNKKDGSDYINANYIQGYNHSKEYIAAQGPLPQTIDDFWRMIWETESETIVMVTNPVEAGNVKCEVYWPYEGTTQHYGSIAVTTLHETIRPSFTVREFTLCQSKKSSGSSISPRTCVQYHYTAWPDMGVPNDCAIMIRFVKRIRSSLTNDRPIVVHCSAGVGRTGTYIALDILLQRMETQDTVNIRKLIMQLRAQRCNMVQTPGQYVFIFKCLLYEYWYGETNIKREELSSHYERLQEAFPFTEDSRLDKEFEGAQDILLPDTGVLKEASNNSTRNRQGTGLPFDFNRVPISLATNDTNYINASYVGCLGRKAEYIITQHPLDNTQRDFWLMILERHVQTVVILGTVNEQDEYWPDYISMEWDDMSVSLIEKDITNNGITAVNIEVESEVSEDYQNVTLYQINDWPTDGSCPQDRQMVLHLIQYITGQNSGLITIHTVPGSQECSGVFAVLHSLTSYLKAFGTVNVMETVKRTLQQRPNCITSREQYEFIYEVLILSIAGAGKNK